MIEQLISTIIDKNIKTINVMRFKNNPEFKDLLTIIVYKLRELNYNIKFITPYLLKVDRMKSLGFSKNVEVKYFRHNTQADIIPEKTSFFEPIKTTSAHNTLVNRKRNTPQSSLLIDRFPIGQDDKSIADRRRHFLNMLG